eukprot:jgi/Psemu1/20052/gm1.20052_g
MAPLQAKSKSKSKSESQSKSESKSKSQSTPKQKQQKQKAKILPSSGAIHTTTTDTRRTFYYSSLIIDHGSSSAVATTTTTNATNANATANATAVTTTAAAAATFQSRWKVHLGDVIAVSKQNPNQTALESIRQWKPNHYVKKSLGWRVGLVVALRKVITRQNNNSNSNNTNNSSNNSNNNTNNNSSNTNATATAFFECHVQWLDKALDLDPAEIRSANLKNVYRPYNTNSKEVGSQLPHVLINCPGRYASLSMVPTEEAAATETEGSSNNNNNNNNTNDDSSYCVLLPVTITMKTNRDFMKHGIKEKEESRSELRFCCTKTRRQWTTKKKKKKENQGDDNGGDTGDNDNGGRNILSERDPDAWVHLNCPSITVNKENSDNDDHDNNSDDNDHDHDHGHDHGHGHTRSTLLPNNTIPEPLQRAWKGWLQTQTQTANDTTTTAATTTENTTDDDENDNDEAFSVLGDALRRGWIQSRRERYNRAVLVREERRRQQQRTATATAMMEKELKTGKAAATKAPATAATATTTTTTTEPTSSRKTSTAIKNTNNGTSTAKPTKGTRTTKQQQHQQQQQQQPPKGASSNKIKRVKPCSGVEREPEPEIVGGSSKKIRTASGPKDSERAATTTTNNNNNNIIKGKRKELRFSADTKPPPSKKKHTQSSAATATATVALKKSKTTTTKGNANAKSSRRKLRPGPAAAAAAAAVAITADDEAASTTTKDTHSTDTTVPTRNRGRKRAITASSARAITASSARAITAGFTGDGGSSWDVQSALRQWKATPRETTTMTTKLVVPFHTTKRKDFFLGLRMAMPTGVVRLLLLDGDAAAGAGVLTAGGGSAAAAAAAAPTNNHCYLDIKVGSVVAVHYPESILKSTTDSWSPFRVPWGVAQVTSIFREKNSNSKGNDDDGDGNGNSDDNDDDDWRLGIKWFYRFPELPSERRTNELDNDSLMTTTTTTTTNANRLVETYESCDCSIKELLPAVIELTSNETMDLSFPSRSFTTQNNKQSNNNDDDDNGCGLPTVRMLCKHLERSHGDIVTHSDWNYDHHDFLAKLLPAVQVDPSTCPSPSPHETNTNTTTLPGPIRRCLELMPVRLRKKYEMWLSLSLPTTEPTTTGSPGSHNHNHNHNHKSNNTKNETATSSSTTTTTTTTAAIPTKLFPFDIVPGTTEPLFCCERSGDELEFFDAIDLNVRKTDLCNHFRSKSTNRWTLAVGHVVAVHCKNATLGRGRISSNSGWYPYDKKWCPGQVVAIYRTKRASCGSSWKMEIRWFDRYHELLPQHKSNEKHKHLKKPHALFETEGYEHLPVTDALPGRIVLTSSMEDNERKNNWDVVTSGATGLPLVPRLCTRFCFDEEIIEASCWTNYDANLSRIPPGLSRGLESKPSHRTGTESVSRLAELYTQAIKLRGVSNDPDHISLQSMSGESHRSGTTQSKEPTRSSFNPEDTELTLGEHLTTIQLGGQGSQNLDFYGALSVGSPSSHLVSPTVGMKRTKRNSFECTPGDIVCYFDSKASTPGNVAPGYRQKKSPWYPFRIPFSYGQVLNIYKESGAGAGGTNNTNSIKIELRRFYRSSDLPSGAKEFLPLPREGDPHEELFESNDIEPGIDASSLLGTVEVLLGNHTTSGDDEHNIRTIVARCRCRFFFLKKFQTLQTLYWSSVSPDGWNRGLRQRGFQRSGFVQKHGRLKDVLAIDKPPRSNIGQIYDVFARDTNSQAEGTCVRLGTQIRSMTPDLSFYKEASLHPQWSLFHASDYWSLADCSNRKLWVLRVGDIVAIKDSKAPQGGLSSYPFKTHWFPGQILAICNDSNGDDDHKSVRFEVRRLHFESAAHPRKLAIYDPPAMVTATSVELLGPLTIYHPGGRCETDLTKIQLHLPLLECWAARSWKVVQEHASAFSELHSPSGVRTGARTIVNRSQTDDDFSPNPVVDEFVPTIPRQAKDEIKPFRIDPLNFRTFYSQMTSTSKPGILLGEITCQQNSGPTTISLGDAIRVRLEGSKRYPYDCNWGVAEVVAIFKEFPSRDEFERDRNLDPEESDPNRFQMEIRWLYERRDISMAASSVNESSSFVEVFETDHCQVVDATDSFLDCVKLVEDTTTIKGNSDNHFLCTRFWSTKRRSLIPCSGANGRIKRGLIHSTLGLEQDLDESQLFGKQQSGSKIVNLANWKDSMANLICKLTLKDASKDVYESGKALVGREKELSQLLTFLRAAFLEDHESEGDKSSILLAGPPGVVSSSSLDMKRKGRSY